MVRKPIRRGDIFWANLPGIGRHRCLVIQNDVLNRHLDETIVVPIITRGKEQVNSWEVEVPEGVCPQPSIINCRAIVTFKISRLEDYVASLDKHTLEGVDSALCLGLGLGIWSR